MSTEAALTKPAAETPPPTPKDASTLAEYSAGYRAFEIFGIAAFFALSGWLAWRLVSHAHVGADVWLILAACLAGYVGADFGSGLVHWGFDTWGSIYTPIVGKSFIRPFREHHFDEKAITRHDFIETNGNNSLVSLPVLVAATFVPTREGESWGLVVIAFVLCVCLATFATNQFHAWAHADEVPKTVRLLQRWHLILPPEHHDIHHQKPHLTHYCITTGWLNPLLRATGFFRILERMITAVTGAIPREDDLA